MSASLPVRVPTVESLLPASFSLASRPVPRGTPCGLLRLPSSVPVGSFHPTRFCPCWAHWGRLLTCGRLSIGLRRLTVWLRLRCFVGQTHSSARDRLVALLRRPDYSDLRVGPTENRRAPVVHPSLPLAQPRAH